MNSLNHKNDTLHEVEVTSNLNAYTNFIVKGIRFV